MGEGGWKGRRVPQRCSDHQGSASSSSNQSWGGLQARNLLHLPSRHQGQWPAKISPSGGWQDEGQTRETLVSRS